MILEEKKLNEIKKRVEQYLNEGIIKTKKPIKYVEFYMRNAEDSLNSARCLFDMSTNTDFQQKVGYVGLKGFLWVINASYYSMFYMTRALLENKGMKIISDLSIHSRTFDALVYFFYLTGKLKKSFFQYYVQAKEEAADLLGQQKADELIKEYFFEKGKRADFTYQTGEYAMESKAKTSLKRAVRFNKEIKRIIRQETPDIKPI